MSVYKRSRLNKLCSIAAAIVLLVSVLLCIFVCNLFVHIEEMSRTECRLAAEKIINSAVKEAVAFSAVQELITENRDKNGAIQSISLERTGANKLSALISDAVTEKLEQTKSIPIPVGTLSGISFLSGRGFDISLYLSCHVVLKAGRIKDRCCRLLLKFCRIFIGRLWLSHCKRGEKSANQDRSK